MQEENKNTETATAGNTPAVSAQLPIEMVEQYLNENYIFRLNEVTGKIDYRSKIDDEPREVNDYFINSVNKDMQKQKIKCNTSMVRNLLNSSFTPKFNPFHNYLHSLGAWDGTTDHITDLAAMVTTTNDELFAHCFKKWLVAMVGSLLHDSTINHCVMILSGAQGIGKTMFFQSLIPAALKEYQYSGTINPNNKDTLIHLAECFLINMDELENLNRTEIGSLKAIITQPTIRVRRPYGYSSENLPHRASLCGSVNGNQFLSDTTGSRRFLCFEATAINYKHGINVDQVFAQAVALYNSGFQFWFDQAEIKLINENNEQFRHQSLEEETLMAHYEPCEIEDATKSYTTTALLEELALKDGNLQVSNAAKYALGKALNANKFKRHKQKGVYVYAVRKKGIEKTTINHYQQVIQQYQAVA